MSKLDLERVARGVPLPEPEMSRAKVRIGKKRTAAAKAKRQADLKAEAQKIVRGEYRKSPKGGPITDALAARQREFESNRRPNESGAMQQRLAGQQRRQKLASIRAQVDERFTNFRKVFGE